MAFDALNNSVSHSPFGAELKMLVANAVFAREVVECYLSEYSAECDANLGISGIAAGVFFEARTDSCPGHTRTSMVRFSNHYELAGTSTAVLYRPICCRTMRHRGADVHPWIA